MSNLNEGVGKKIVEALKKQSEMESGEISREPVAEPENLGVDLSPMDALTSDVDMQISQNIEEDVELEEDVFSNDLGQADVDAFPDFAEVEEKVSDVSEMPSNILILKKLISQLPSGVTRHTGAQIIRQTMEALGISMKSVLTEAQEVQSMLKESSKECQATIQEYKRKIVALEKQTQNYQKQYSALNDLISLFIQTSK